MYNDLSSLRSQQILFRQWEKAMKDKDDKNSERKEDSGIEHDLVELYEKMSRYVREKVEKAGVVSEEMLERTLKESRDLAKKVKETHGDDIGKVSDFLRRDWQEAVRITRERTRKNLDLDRLQVGVMGLLSKLAHSAGSQLEGFSTKLSERLTYKTGEIAGAGTLACQECGQQLQFEKPTRIPPCPKCRGAVFRRNF